MKKTYMVPLTTVVEAQTEDSLLTYSWGVDGEHQEGNEGNPPSGKGAKYHKFEPWTDDDYSTDSWTTSAL